MHIISIYEAGNLLKILSMTRRQRQNITQITRIATASICCKRHRLMISGSLR